MLGKGIRAIFAYNPTFTRNRLIVKFAFVIFKYFPFGGAQRDMMRIARELVKRGHEIHVFTMSWEGPAPDGGIVAHVVRSEGWTNHRRYQDFIRRIRSQIADMHFDLLVGFNRMPGLDAYYAADPCFIERSYLERGWLYRLTGRYRFFLECEKAVFSPDIACEILLLSLNEKTVFQHWYATPEARFHLLPPFISAERFVLGDCTAMRAEVRAEFGFGADDLLLLLVGSGFRTKGLDRAIHALSVLPRDLRSRTRLLAVGQDNPLFFRKMAEKLGIAAHVHVVAGRNDVPRLMQAADLLIHPAYRENTGLVLLEAMASGLPVLASDVCGYAFHVEKAGAGALVKSPFDQRQFDLQVRHMLTSERHAEWSANGRKYAAALMAANDGIAEATMIEQFARRKAEST
jgi:UDP-glucose:(heptosyl)LPS alpha-1,3-glucosyltransferase